MEGGRLQLLHEEDELDERELYLNDYPSLGDGSTIILMHSPTWKIHVEYPQGKSFTLQISDPEVCTFPSMLILIGVSSAKKYLGNPHITTLIHGFWCFVTT